jgi:hypothetical protein
VTRSVRYRAGGQGRGRPALGRLLGGLVLLAAGCGGGGGGGAASVPSFSPADVGAAALAEYDTNKDGALDAKELEKCPALREAFKQGLDKNKDGRVTADEIADRMRIFQEEGWMGSVFVEVSLDGKPLAGATVTLTPEKFLGPSFQPVTKTTEPTGTTMLPLVPYGYYRVEVSKKGADGKEIIPARYNAQTTLGHEVAPARALNLRGYEDKLVLRLTSR